MHQPGLKRIPVVSRVEPPERKDEPAPSRICIEWVGGKTPIAIGRYQCTPFYYQPMPRISQRPGEMADKVFLVSDG